MKNAMLLSCLTFILMVQSCQQNSNELPHITPPAEGLDLQTDQYEVLAEEGKTIKIKNGGTLEIPANAFVDELGNPIQGKVSIEYREFHSSSSIITSGIPMTFEENGKIHHFQTAGMFEIRGFQVAPKKAQLFGSKKKKNRGKKVFIDKSKSINVNMASFTGEDGFNFYQLDDQTGKWKEVNKSTPVVNEEKKAKLEKEAPLPIEPVTPEKHNPKKPVFELNMDSNKFPELAHLKGTMWEYAGSNPKEDPTASQNRWIGKVPWSDIAVKANENEEGRYRMTLKHKNKSFAFDVKPVLIGRNYKKALKKFEHSLVKFEKAKEKRKQAEERLATEGSFIRTASINSFGVYNHDRYYSLDQAISVKASFKLEDDNPIPNDATVFLVTGDDRTIIKYPKSNWTNFKYIPSEENKLLTILSDGKVGIYTSQDFKNLNQSEGNHQLFRLKVVNNINSFDDFQNLMANL